MPLIDTTTVSLERALSGATLRHETLAQNLANANVPGYQRKDVDFHGALQRAMGDDRASVENVAFTAQPDGTGAVRADGGGVDPDREASLIAQNSLESDSLSSVLKGRMAILRSAIGA